MKIRAEAAGDRLAQALAALTKSQRVQQAIVAVESGDRSFRWVGTEGETTNGGRVVEHTPFFIASIDKLYNATITMLLSETAQLDIDKPINVYLPETITRRLHYDRGRDFSGQITVRHLLTHTSGLADWFEDYPKGGASLAESIFENGDRRLTIEEMAAYVRDCLTPHFPPQDLSGKRPRVRYSDTNFMLVIAIIEAVTGRPLYENHERMLYEPLGLRQTCFPGLNQPMTATSAPMTLRANGAPLEMPMLIQSVGGIYSTAADMIEFLRRLVHNEVFQRPETLDAMLSGWRRFGFPLDRAALRSPNWPIEYGMGVMRFKLPRLFTPAAPMPAVMGHTGSTGCWLFHCSEWDMFLAGSVEEVTAGAVPFRTVPRILSILRKCERRDRE